MHTKNITKPIVFIGLMGSGKSAVGKYVAKELDRTYFDSDQVIVEKAGLSIPELFDLEGEDGFRKRERDVMLALLKKNNTVIASGGGAFLNEEVRTCIKANAVSVWLRADIEVLHERTRNKTHRPLLNTRDPKTVLGELVKARYPIYSEADIVVDTFQRPISQTASCVMAALQKHPPTGRGT